MKLAFKHIIILLTAYFVCYSGLHSQDRPVIGVPTFDFSENNALNLASQVTEEIIDLINQSGRYTVVDMTSGDQRQEALQRAQENYKAENWIDAYKATNAEHILAGEITSIKFVKSGSTTQPGYRAAITMTLKLMDVESSEIRSTASFASSKSELRLTPETALTSALASIHPEILQFFQEHVKQSFSIVKIAEEKNGKVKMLVIELYQNLPFDSGDKLKVIWHEKIGNQIIPQIIGEVKLKEHISGNFWKAQVTDGDRSIYDLKDQLNKLRCAE